MATSRSKPTRRMSQPSPLPQRSSTDGDADDELFLPVARSSPNLGIFQLPPPALHRQGSHESSSSENDPAQSPGAGSRTGSCSSRPTSSKHFSTPDLLHATPAATISTSATATPGSNDHIRFDSRTLSSDCRTDFRTSPPQLSASQNVPSLSLSSHAEDKVLNDQNRTFEAKNPFRPPSPYGDIVEPSSPVVLDGYESFEDTGTTTIAPREVHDKPGTSVARSLFTFGPKPPVVPASPPSLPSSSSVPNNKSQVSSTAISSNTTSKSAATISSHTTNQNDSLHSLASSNGRIMNKNNDKHSVPCLSRDNHHTPEEKNTAEDFTTVSLSNDIASHGEQNLSSVVQHHDANHNVSSLEQHEDANHKVNSLEHNEDANHNKNSSHYANFSSLYFNNTNNNDRCGLAYNSFDSDVESSFTTTTSINNNNNNHQSSPDGAGLKTRRTSIVDGLLQDIRDRLHLHGRSDSVDSDTMTECSSTSDAPFYHHGYGVLGGGYRASHLNRSVLQSQSKSKQKYSDRKGVT
ncbi:hypothetical protein ElyMa_007037700 [Elysia marginata]|uniref:Uncharacterized protein n=1 Tax=Elysia marginata TaxID=1093978 RepID=A0AAV4JV88_9GAST|nr:hypothetical protein ElyMa_007037700 [Elysia marginata]